MSVSDQIMKGLLDGAILGLISQEETYAYEITKKLEGHDFPNISEKYINTRMVKSDSGGPKRKIKN